MAYRQGRAAGWPDAHRPDAHRASPPRAGRQLPGGRCQAARQAVRPAGLPPAVGWARAAADRDPRQAVRLAPRLAPQLARSPPAVLGPALVPSPRRAPMAPRTADWMPSRPAPAWAAGPRALP